MNAISTSDLSLFNGEPRIIDLRLAEALEYGQPRDIRKLVLRKLTELQRYGEVCATVAQTLPSGGRPGNEFRLNEAQAVLVCMFSDTPRAADARQEVIEVFMAWRRGDRAQTGSYALPNAAYADSEATFADVLALPVARTRAELVSLSARLHGPERARALWQSLGLPLPPAHLHGPQSDARACFLHLLLAKLSNGQTFAEAIDAAMDEQEEPRIVLKGCGVVVEPGVDGVIVANRGQYLEMIYEGTDWAHCRWRHALRRLAGASGEDARRRYGDRQHRGTFVPAVYLDLGQYPAM